MASKMEVGWSLNHGAPSLRERDSVTAPSAESVRVLNAVSNLTLQRTIVEAFVKLVVCRKVTVQRVAPLTGRVLDSHTTQVTVTPRR